VLINTLLPLLLIFISISILYFYRNERYLILLPIFWFIVSTILFYGLGPLIYIIGNQSSIDYLNRFYPVNNDDLLIINSFNFTFLLLIYILYFLINRILDKFNIDNYKKIYFHENLKASYLIIMSLCFIGILGKILLSCKNNQFGEFFNVLFDMYSSVAMLSPILFFKLKNKIYKIFLVILILILLLLLILIGSKLKLFEFILALALGFYLSNKSLKLFVLAFFILILSFNQINSIFSNVRNSNYLCNLLIKENNISIIKDNKLVENFKNLDLKSEVIITENKPNYAWIRFVLVPNQVYVKNLRDKGIVINSLNVNYWIFVPRILNKNKPSIHPLSYLNNSLNINYDVLLNSGYLSEIFWNFGWNGVYTFSLVIAISIMFSNIFFKIIIQNNIYILTPLLFFILNFYIRQEDWISMNFLYKIPALIYLTIMLLFIYTSIKILKKHI